MDTIRPAISKTQMANLIARGWMSRKEVEQMEILSRETKSGVEYLLYPERILLKPDGTIVANATP